MSRRDKLTGIFADTSRELAAANSLDAEEANDRSRVLAGPVRTMGLALDRLDQEARDLQAALQSGDTVVELDPELIEISFVRDRLDEAVTEDDPLVQSIAENGQEVPILVRQHPELNGRYQVAYGHRRLIAVRLLGRKVRAVVRPLTDAQLVVAQGIENTARKDLSYIERALFALSLEAKGFGRDVIMQALNTDKTELSKLLSVARAIPADLVRAIGPAPSIGRRKWMELSEKIAEEQHLDRLRKAAASEQFMALASDDRFAFMLAKLAQQPKGSSEVTQWHTRDGKLTARIKNTGKAYSLSLKATAATVGFGTFLSGKLDEIYAEWQAQNTKE
ncbi:plasmid partitioning protein RepB [Phyllobacterium sp. 0TCS1.6C]|uniref:plasmid partitioning protein RepB n=1 Tax=unclassified Phyllobacterium TaxID=2638441 RepID=UPI002264D93E|nr:MULTISPECIES: plasmid partitioning protein RepB [unclassified Phyllobacterium]MCX8280115.1 plasmid partitioning protein RepB [Phyllobacterium sp. 0TCS1.6C]MCX8294323.1 plasmid partitioning protein RepB [Phyllobacterium sp. 0TCS1.6A]